LEAVIGTPLPTLPLKGEGDELNWQGIKEFPLPLEGGGLGRG
jgi:hypothetical protein